MPDLNELLKWSIAKSTPKDAPDQPNGADEPLSLRFNPPSENPSSGSSALHPSDPLYGSASSALTPAPQHGQPTPTPSQSALNSEILETIMGKPDSTVMKEKMDFAMDESFPVDERVEALDDFEMLIEHLDNANNMAVLKLWEPLLTLLSSPHETIVAHACWIMGTAVQNNLKAQAALYTFNALPPILDVIAPSTSHTAATRSRATYALSSALKHWPLASSALSAESSRGYQTLRSGVSDAEPSVKRKMAFLVGTLVMQSGEVYRGEIPKEVTELIQQRTHSTEVKESLIEGLKRERVFAALLDSLKVGRGEDVEFEENAIRALTNALDQGGLDGQEKEELARIWSSWGPRGREERGLQGDEARDIEQKLK